MYEGPAGWFDTGLGGCGGGMILESFNPRQLAVVDGAAHREIKVVDVVAAVLARIAGGKDVAEGNVATIAGVAGKADGDMFGCGTAVVDGGDGYKSAGIAEVGHYTDLELVFSHGLFDVHAELKGAYIAIDSRHGIEAPFVEDEAVVAAVGVGTAIVNHGFVLVGHGYVLVDKRPASGFYAGLGSCGGGVGVKVVGVWHVGTADAAVVVS